MLRRLFVLQALQEKYGGWLNQSDVMVKVFTDYSDLCFREFGDRVKFWITFNEPFIVAQLGKTYRLAINKINTV